MVTSSLRENVVANSTRGTPDGSIQAFLLRQKLLFPHLYIRPSVNRSMPPLHPLVNVARTGPSSVVWTTTPYLNEPSRLIVKLPSAASALAVAVRSLISSVASTTSPARSVYRLVDSSV